jgi:hypothetical protein
MTLHQQTAAILGTIGRKCSDDHMPADNTGGAGYSVAKGGT